MRRRVTVLMFVVMMITSVVAVAAAIIAGHHVPALGTAVQVGQERVMAPIASIPFVLAGFWVMMRIWKAESRRMYEAQTVRRPEAP